MYRTRTAERREDHQRHTSGMEYGRFVFVRSNANEGENNNAIMERGRNARLAARIRIRGRICVARNTGRRKFHAVLRPHATATYGLSNHEWRPLFPGLCARFFSRGRRLVYPQEHGGRASKKSVKLLKERKNDFARAFSTWHGASPLRAIWTGRNSEESRIGDGAEKASARRYRAELCGISVVARQGRETNEDDGCNRGIGEVRPLRRKEKSAARRLFVADATANSCPERCSECARARAPRAEFHRASSSELSTVSRPARITSDDDEDEDEDEHRPAKTSTNFRVPYYDDQSLSRTRVRVSFLQRKLIIEIFSCRYVAACRETRRIARKTLDADGTRVRI